MGTLQSPGVLTTETDLTTGVQQISTREAAIATEFLWGPVNEAQLISSEDNLVKYYGKPNDVNFKGWFSAKNFLDYSASLWVTRIINETTSLDKNDQPFNATAGQIDGFGSSCQGTGTINADATTTITGTTTVFETELNVGDKLIVPDTSGNVVVEIVSIANNTSMVVNTSVTVADSSDFFVPGWLLVKNDSQYEAGITDMSHYGDFVARYPGSLGESLRVSVCPGANAYFYDIQSISANIESNTTGTFVSGTFTATNTLITLNETKLVYNGKPFDITASNSTTITLQQSIGEGKSVTFTTSDSVGLAWQYWDQFDNAPGTSTSATSAGASNDEMHIIVLDEEGTITGTRNTILERFAKVSKATNAKKEDGTDNYYKNVINDTSNYIRWLDHPGTNTSNWGTAFTSGKVYGCDDEAIGMDFYNGSDGSVVGVSDKYRGYDIYKNKDLYDISYFVMGDSGATVVEYVMSNICITRSDCQAFCSPMGSGTYSIVNRTDGREAQRIVDYRDTINISSSYGFMDGNYKYQYDKYNSTHRWVPLNGDIAGICAYTDYTGDFWDSPGHGKIKNVTKFAFNPDQTQRDLLYKNGINPCYTDRSMGPILKGDKTMLRTESVFTRQGPRRLFIVLRKSISKMAEQFLFKQNTPFTQQQFRSKVEPYLRNILAKGGIEKFLVDCDESVNTPDVRNDFAFKGNIYIIPTNSINFIYLDFIAVRSGVEFNEIIGRL